MTPEAVLFDALGTLVELLPPAPRLQDALARRGLDVDAERAGRALKAEIAFYRAEHHAAGTRAGLERLRDRCAEVLEAELHSGLGHAEVRAALLEAIAFVPYPEVADALGALRRGGRRLAVVSNWDVSLHDVLAGHGLDACFDAVLTSAEAGVAKPDPRIFEAALARLGVAAADAVHVGDDLALDVAGALGAGCRAVLVVRGDAATPSVPAGVAIRTSLADL